MKLFLSSFAVLVALGVAQGASIPKNSIQLKNIEVLDGEGKYILGWEINEAGDEIVFEVEAETLGWVGFGISPQGGMTGADIFIGGVLSDGSTYAQDRFGIGRTEPKVDDHSDWRLLEAMELPSMGKTILKFSRLLDTCDDEDYLIGNDTNRLIWAMGDADIIRYHGTTRRGTKSTNLIHADLPELDLDTVQTWPMILDMEMPTVDTSYWCSFHRGPVLSAKHHVVGFNAVLPSAEALQHTHHSILYNCFLPAGSNETLEEVLGNYTVDKGHVGGDCYDPDTILPISYCIMGTFYVWAKGGKTLVFPEDAGYPIGDLPGQQFYMMEIHYDNPDMIEGLKFETGVEFYYTDELRPQEAGIMILGHEVDLSTTVPPNTPSYKDVGHCGSECTNMFPENGINVFNSLLHSHLSGRKMKARHFRGNVELPWLDYDDHYDFDYQQNKPLMTHVNVQRGDHITVECEYDSVWKNGEIVLGGLSTREEMCEDIVWYYPKINVELCTSGYDIDAHIREFGVTAYTETMTPMLRKYYIDAPENLQGDFFDSITYKFNWTEEFRTEYTNRRMYGIHTGACGIRDEVVHYDITYPESFIEYVPPNQCQA
ncbi:DBH-like monooxygenase protein 1 [Folsomia candida]|nr:DBH-like monooxygenase protein 1 [Folsomia candida]